MPQSTKTTEEVKVPLVLLQEIQEVLEAYQFSDGGFSNNEDVLEVLHKLEEVCRAGS